MKKQRDRDNTTSKVVYCAQCAFAQLVRFGNTPILVECKTLPAGERNVASGPTKCPFFLYSNIPKCIKTYGK